MKLQRWVQRLILLFSLKLHHWLLISRQPACSSLSICHLHERISNRMHLSRVFDHFSQSQRISDNWYKNIRGGQGWEWEALSRRVEVPAVPPTRCDNQLIRFVFSRHWLGILHAAISGHSHATLIENHNAVLSRFRESLKHCLAVVMVKVHLKMITWLTIVWIDTQWRKTSSTRYMI